MKKLFQWVGDRTSLTLPDKSSANLVFGKLMELDDDIPFVRRLLRKGLLVLIERATSRKKKAGDDD